MAAVSDFPRELEELVADRRDRDGDRGPSRSESEMGIVGPVVDRAVTRDRLTAKKAAHEVDRLTETEDDVSAADAQPAQRLEVMGAHTQTDAPTREKVERRHVCRDLARIRRVDRASAGDLDTVGLRRDGGVQRPRVGAKGAVREQDDVESELVRENAEPDELVRIAEIIDEADAEARGDRGTGRQAVGAAGGAAESRVIRAVLMAS